MNFHVVLSRCFDLDRFEKDSKEKKCPRHSMLLLADKLGATIHQPDYNGVTLTDKIGSSLIGQPAHWALARQLVPQLTKNDIVFCIGEDCGFPIAFRCGADRPKLAVFIHNIDRPRGRCALQLMRHRKEPDLFITNTSVKAEFLSKYLGLSEERVYLVSEQADTEFFTPGSPSSDKTRKIVGSGGLEQRDYRTLAEATKDLNVEVKISAVSPNAKVSKKTFPPVMPDNMSADHYNWIDLLQLYRDSDVFVISLQDHNYQAGFTTLFESSACRRPIVMTATPGPVAGLAEKGVLKGIRPNSPVEMKQAIQSLLSSPEEAQIQAQKAYDLVTTQHTVEHYVDSLAQEITKL